MTVSVVPKGMPASSRSARRAMKERETYLDDGLYALFDGFMMILRAPWPGGVGMIKPIRAELKETR